MIKVSKVEELLEKCNEVISIRKIGVLSYFTVAFWSFTNSFTDIQNKISFDGFGKDDFNKYIKVCDNRLDRAKTFLNDIAIVLGFDLLALSIVSTILDRENMLNWLFPLSGIITVISLLVILIFLFVLLVHYRSQVHAWVAFKEKAILMKLPEKEIEKPEAETI